MKSLLKIIVLNVLIGGSFAHAQSGQKMPLVEGGTEKFGMVNLKFRQCDMSVQDIEQDFTPQIKLNPVESRSGNYFTGSIYLSSWTFDRANNRSTFATVELLKGDQGSYVISAEPELTYENVLGIRIVKKSMFFALLDKDLKLADFKERLSYETSKADSYERVRIEGKTRYDAALKTVEQAVETDNSRVSFSRTTETGMKVTVSCDILN